MARGHTLHAIHVPSSSVFLSSLSHKLPSTKIVCPWTLIFTCFAFPITGALRVGPSQHDGSFGRRSDGPCVQGACGHEHRQPSIALCQWRSVEPRSVGLATPLEQSSQTSHILPHRQNHSLYHHHLLLHHLRHRHRPRHHHCHHHSSCSAAATVPTPKVGQRHNHNYILSPVPLTSPTSQSQHLNQ
jgi:hypothetical protein